MGGSHPGHGMNQLVSSETELAAAPLAETLAALKAKYADLQNSHSDEVKTLASQLEETESQVSAQHFHILHLRAEAASREAEAAAAAAAAAEEISGLTRALMHAQKEVEGAKKEASVAGAVAKSAEEEAERAVGAAAESAGAAEAARVALRNAERSAERLGAELEALRESSKGIRTRIEELEEERGAYEERLDEARKETQGEADAHWETKLALKQVEMKVADLERRIVGVEEGREKATAALNAEQSVVAGLRAALKRVEGELERERSSKDENARERIALGNEVAVLKGDLEGVKAELEKAQGAHAEVAGKLVGVESQLATAVERVEQVEGGDLVRVRAELAGEQGVVADLKHDKAMLQREVRRLEGEVEALAGEGAESATQVIQLKAELERMRRVVAVSKAVEEFDVGRMEGMMAGAAGMMDGLKGLMAEIEGLKEFEAAGAGGE